MPFWIWVKVKAWAPGPAGAGSVGERTVPPHAARAAVMARAATAAVARGAETAARVGAASGPRGGGGVGARNPSGLLPEAGARPAVEALFNPRGPPAPPRGPSLLDPAS